jgi:hypothetical protein
MDLKLTNVDQASRSPALLRLFQEACNVIFPAGNIPAPFYHYNNSPSQLVNF